MVKIYIRITKNGMKTQYFEDYDLNHELKQ